MRSGHCEHLGMRRDNEELRDMPLIRVECPSYIRFLLLTGAEIVLE